MGNVQIKISCDSVTKRVNKVHREKDQENELEVQFPGKPTPRRCLRSMGPGEPSLAEGAGRAVQTGNLTC